MSNEIKIHFTTFTSFASTETPLNFDAYQTSIAIESCTFSFLQISSILTILTSKKATVNKNCFYNNKVIGNTFTISFKTQPYVDYTNFSSNSDLGTVCDTSGSIGANNELISKDCNVSHTTSTGVNERCGFCPCLCKQKTTIQYLNIANSKGDYIIRIHECSASITFNSISISNCKATKAIVQNMKSNGVQVTFESSMFSLITGTAIVSEEGLTCTFTNCGAESNDATIPTAIEFKEIGIVVNRECLGRIVTKACDCDMPKASKIGVLIFSFSCLNGAVGYAK